MALTDEAITKLRNMIQSGELPPGSRLPSESQLAMQLGLSRSGIREAVKVLESARVLDVRRGDGTFVTSLAPGLLLEGVGFAVELLQGDTLQVGKAGTGDIEDRLRVTAQPDEGDDHRRHDKHVT